MKHSVNFVMLIQYWIACRGSYVFYYSLARLLNCFLVNVFKKQADVNKNVVLETLKHFAVNMCKILVFSCYIAGSILQSVACCFMGLFAVPSLGRCFADVNWIRMARYRDQLWAKHL